MMTMFKSDWQNKFNALDPNKHTFLRDAVLLISELVPLKELSESHRKPNITSIVSTLILELDRRLSRQLDTVLHHPDFQSLESNWRQVQYLCHQPVSRQRTKLKLLNMNWQEVSKDLNQSYSIKQTRLFNFIGNHELNTLGGQPFGCIAFTEPVSMDLSLNSDFDDMYTLGLISQLGEQTLCPMLSSPNRQFFSDTGADWLTNTTRIKKILQSPDYIAWQELRMMPSARFLGLAIPSIKLRERYNHRRAGFLYQESAETLWGTACIAFLGIIMREHHRIGWFGFLKARWNDRNQGSVISWDGGEQSDMYQECDTYLFGKIATFYSNQGFVPLTRNNLTGKLLFNGNNSVWAPKDNDNDKVLAQLQTTLMCCRIAHYLKVQVREMIGSFTDIRECEQFLRNWIEKFSSNVSYANEETLAKYPLSKAHVSINESRTNPGHFSCTLKIVPQYQFDHFNGEVVLTTELGEMMK
ncbi:type VI secretion system contractile sheath domain-containing protein [Vibrio cionasavignyae]|uniref:type VI secretion system contractile sheath domain-containing protein n=1 Tax=Vibrio cionasavignyae TaxID=2910252 RepID=UPI003D1116D8